ncbi:GNAT family N-acetyltransferase [Falsibacillus albus]|nr:GNAT family N-acetyltransferase [Falsibacillus albus]
MKRLFQCTLEESVTAWNKGFEGYYFDASTDVDRFTKRMISDGLQPSISIIAFEDGSPVGLVLSGKRKVRGVTMSWNGGTGVATEYRRHGIGKELMAEAMSIYQEENVDVATLEAISQNEKAIKLYEKMGYRIVDGINHYTLKGEWQETDDGKRFFNIKKGSITDIKQFALYQDKGPWQAQWEHIADAEAWISINEEGNVNGYAIYKNHFNEEGTLQAVTLFQANTAADQEGGSLLQALVRKVFQPEVENLKRTAAFIPVSNKNLVALLLENGFETSVEQVYMVKPLTDKGDAFVQEYYAFSKQDAH